MQTELIKKATQEWLDSFDKTELTYDVTFSLTGDNTLILEYGPMISKHFIQPSDTLLHLYSYLEISLIYFSGGDSVYHKIFSNKR